MIFNSLQFIFFFIAVTITYWVLPHRFRWFFLLLASCYFYMALVPEYILILLFTIIIDYFAGIIIENSKADRRKWWLVISIISNVGILAIFKYFDFLTGNLNAVYQLFTGEVGHFKSLDEILNWGTKVLLPVGLSFHTFQAMSYTIEVYRGHQKAERHFGKYALYVMFYPQLVAGPIERPQNVLPQFHEVKTYDFENLKAGLMRMAWGFFKKVVIADRLGLLIDPAYAHSQLAGQNNLNLLLATFLYSIQIYCDFSGYTDIALGAARVMGFNLMENFQNPYFSKSIGEYWRRWHISLSSWFKDYVFIPMGGSRRSKYRNYLNIMTIFLLSGLWHGNTWNYVIWGSIHGFYIVLGQEKDKLLGNWMGKTQYKYLHVILTFCLISLAWPFFRGESMADTMLIYSKFTQISLSQPWVSGLNTAELIFSFILIIILFCKEYFYPKISTNNTTQFALLFAGILMFSYFFGVFNAKQFIYFQF